MNVLRTTIFAIVSVSYTVMVFLLCLAMPIVFLNRNLIRRVSRLWAASILWIGHQVYGIKYVVHISNDAMSDPPKSHATNHMDGAMVVAKHTSVWETMFLFAHFPGAVFIVKRSLFVIPIFGWFLKWCGMIGIDRADPRSAIRALKFRAMKSKARHKSKLRLIIFPQGTRVAHDRTDYSLEKYPYKQSFLALSQELALPMIPVKVDAAPIWGRGFFSHKRRGVIDVYIYPAIQPPIDKTERKDALDRIVSLLEP